MARVTTSNSSPANATHLGFEATLWATADRLRGNANQQSLGGVIDLISNMDFHPSPDSCGSRRESALILSECLSGLASAATDKGDDVCGNDNQTALLQAQPLCTDRTGWRETHR